MALKTNSIFFILILSICLLAFTSVTQATTLTASTNSENYTENDDMYIDPGLSLVSNETFSSAVIYIGDGYTSGEDYLMFTNANGITGSFSSSNGVLTLSGSGNASVYQEALRNVRYVNTNENPSTAYRNITFVMGGNSVYNPDTGHYYESVYVSSSITWTAAKTAAESRSLSGMQGYLATITSENENTFVGSKVSADAWIGASDAASEGDWRWVTGPEGEENGGLGRAFYYGRGDQSGYAVNGEYNNWASGEPNDYLNGNPGEDYAHMYGSRAAKEWNDYPNSGNVKYYLVEYGGMSGDPETVPQLTATIRVNVQSVNDAPTTPGAFSSPESGQIKQGGSQININWGSSTDPEGDSVKYNLWFFNGSWTQIGNMLATAGMAFSLPEDDTNNATLRVYANDSQNSSSPRDVTFTIDSKPPKYAWIKKVTNCSTGENISLILNVTDISGIDIHNITVDGQEYEMNQLAGNYYWNISVPSTSSGNASGSIIYWCNFSDNFGFENSTGESIINVSILPFADFSANVSRGTSPLTVAFTDNSAYANQWHWDFSDGDTSEEQNPVHLFSAGNFTVNLTVSNPNGSSSKTFNVRAANSPEYTRQPSESDIISIYGDEVNFSVKSNLLSGFKWFIDGNELNGTGVTCYSGSNNLSDVSYCRINSSQYLNLSNFFMDTYNVSVTVSNQSTGMNDTIVWNWTLTNSSATEDSEDICFIVEKKANVTVSGNQTLVEFNTTDDTNRDTDNITGSIVSVSFTTSGNAGNLYLKIEVVNKTLINNLEKDFSSESVYQYLDISFNNKTLANEMGASRNIEFRVLSELNGGSLVIKSVRLRHHDSNTWESYEPELIENDGTYSYYLVRNVTGYSPFAITASYSYPSETVASDDGMPNYLKLILLNSGKNKETASPEKTADEKEPLVIPIKGELVNEQQNAGNPASDSESGTKENIPANRYKNIIITAMLLIIAVLMIAVYIMKNQK